MRAIIEERALGSRSAMHPQKRVHINQPALIAFAASRAAQGSVVRYIRLTVSETGSGGTYAAAQRVNRLDQPNTHEERSSLGTKNSNPVRMERESAALGPDDDSADMAMH